MKLNVEKIAELSASAGTPQFMPYFQRFISKQIRIDHVAMEFIDSKRNLFPIDRASLSSLPIKELGAAYRRGMFYETDPARDLATKGQEIAPGIRILRNKPDEIEDSRYRQQVFERFGLGERIIVGRAVTSGWICLKLIRMEHFGSVSRTEESNIQGIADFITSAALPHLRLILAIGDPKSWLFTGLHSPRGLAIMFPKLSAREIECLSLLLSGKTNKQAAQVMSVSPNTLITLRARAYKKLALSDLAELNKRITDYVWP